MSPRPASLLRAACLAWCACACRAGAAASLLAGLSLSLLAPCGLAQANAGGARPEVQAGLRLMNDPAAGNCAGCHRWPGVGGLTSSFGPDLGGAGARWSRDQLRQWVTDARQIRPGTLMPPFGTVTGLQRPQPAQPVLNAEQIERVVDALQSLR